MERCAGRRVPARSSSTRSRIVPYVSPSSPVPTESRERHRLFSPLALAGLVAVAAAGLLMVFPGASLVEQVYRYRQHDALSERYITSLLRADPGNDRLRLAL